MYIWFQSEQLQFVVEYFAIIKINNPAMNFGDASIVIFDNCSNSSIDSFVQLEEAIIRNLSETNYFTLFVLSGSGNISQFVPSRLPVILWLPLHTEFNEIFGCNVAVRITKLVLILPQNINQILSGILNQPAQQVNVNSTYMCFGNASFSTFAIVYCLI